MAVRFAVASTPWNTPSTWDNGAVPLAGDTVHPNGFTVPIDTDINVASLINYASPVILPGIPIPNMTSNTQPSGIANAGSDVSNAWKAFNQTPSPSDDGWTGAGVGSGTAWVSYQFPAGQAKIIKRYYFYRQNLNQRPISWIFQGSNDGSTWDNLETVTSNTATTGYLSGVLPNTTAYLYYRLNVTAVVSGTITYIWQFEMTESIIAIYGNILGGGFTVPNTLSGTRNITFSGAGMCVTTNTMLTIAALSGNIVNINVSSGGYILNQTLQQTNTTSILISGTCVVNFNGDIWGCQVNNLYFTTNNQIIANNASTINVFGNLYSCRGNGAYLTSALIAISNASNILNITGNLIGGTYASTVTIIYLGAASTVNVTGNLTADIGACIVSPSSPLVNINSGIITVTNQNSQPAINMTSYSSLLTINGSIINKANINAVFVPKIRFAATSTPYWIYQTNGVSDMTLAYGSATGPYPVEADVRFGTTYAAIPTRIGTLRVPLPQYVSQGVLTDNTTGTMLMTPADFWNAATSGMTTSGSIGERLKTASTVQTNGDQLAAYIV